MRRPGSRNADKWDELYLLQPLNLKLRPKLWKELRPGARIVSHCWDMGDWEPQKQIEVDGRRVYFWTIPAKVASSEK